MANDDISKQAIIFIKNNKKLLIKKFAHDALCKWEVLPFSIFMAGSAGAGKTEFSKNFLRKSNLKAIRIDADEIKDIIPQYNGGNASQIQGASALGVEYLYDYVLKGQKSMILDATFANYDKSYNNICRSLKKGRYVEIFYVYQDPLIAWKFTKAREKLEGRVVPVKIFIDSFFKSRENVGRIKKELGEQIRINIVVKNFEHTKEILHLNVKNIDNYLKSAYTVKSLTQKLSLTEIP